MKLLLCTGCRSLVAFVSILSLFQARTSFTEALVPKEEVRPTDADDPIQDAINKSRHHLKHNTPPDAPYAFPNTRYRLAIMLESKLQHGSSVDTVKEMIQLYQQAASNTTMPLDASQRISAYCNAADLIIQYEVTTTEKQRYDSTSADNISFDVETVLGRAFDVVSTEGDKEEDLAPYHGMAFEKLVQWYLREVSMQLAATNATETSKPQVYLERALQLCDKCSKLCPHEPIVDEKRGAVLRLFHGMQSGNDDKGGAILAGDKKTAASNSKNDNAKREEIYKSFEAAAQKSHLAAMRTLTEFAGLKKATRHKYGTLPKISTSQKSKLQSSLEDDDNDLEYVADIWNRLIRHILLAASSAKEADDLKQEKRHWDYGLAILSSELATLLSLDPEIQADFFVNVGIHYKKQMHKSPQGSMDALQQKAAMYFQKALEAHPNDGHALVQLASLENYDVTDATVRLDDSYVAGLFDGYSRTFEDALVKDLQYVGHELVANALFESQDWVESSVRTEANDPSNSTMITIVDLGCGTGLLGELLRTRLDDILTTRNDNDQACSSSNNNQEHFQILGVDLSSRMVDLSRTRTLPGGDSYLPVYNDVQVSDAVSYLQSIQENSVNAITASDVFIYVGALDKVFAECARVLKTNGLVAFTIEQIPPKFLPNQQSGVVKLLKSGRFGHSKAYVEQVGKPFGLEMQLWEEAVLRTQGGDDVPGAVVTMKKQN